MSESGRRRKMERKQDELLLHDFQAHYYYRIVNKAKKRKWKNKKILYRF